MATNKEKVELGKEIKVGGMQVKVKSRPPRKARPQYYCQKCDRSFPSQLDLEEHMKIDHSKKISP
jgi:hypothetical protein